MRYLLVIMGMFWDISQFIYMTPFSGKSEIVLINVDNNTSNISTEIWK